MSNTRSISASVWARSEKSASSQRITWRVGASRLPSRIGNLGSLLRRPGSKRGARAWPPRPVYQQPRKPRLERIERSLEAAGMGPLSLGECLEPVGDLVEAFLAGGAGHARIHVGVFVRLAGNRRFQIVGGFADRQPGCRIAGFLEVFEVAVGM